MRRGFLEPFQTAVVEVREDCGDGAVAGFLAGELGAPGASVEVRVWEESCGLLRQG